MTDDSELDFSRRDWLKTLGAVGAAGALGVGTASAQSVGSGGYHDSPPTGAATHDYERHTTANFGDQPVPTNDWYSSIPLEGIGGSDVLIAALPLIFRTLEGGLAVGHPQNWSTDWNATDQVGNAIMDGATQLTISHADAGTYADVALDDHGDWSASAVFGEGSVSSLRVTMAQGSPFVFCEHSGGVELSFAETADVFADNGNVVGVTVAGRDYGLYAPSGQHWTVGGSTATNAGSYCTVAALPDASYLGTYEPYAYNRVTDTVYDWEYDQAAAEVRTTFSFETESLPESTGTGTITALFPHQWKYSDAPDIDATYPSARGELRISSGSSFTVTYDYGGMLPFLPPTGNYDQTRLEGLIQDVDESIAGGVDQDTYRFGKETGSRLSKVAAVADQIGLDSKRDALLSSVQSGLEEWFTPSQSATFYYDDSLGVLQGIQSSHGSVADVSDHHFHFGHYVWAASRVARHNPTWADQSNWGGMVKELISDYANPDRTSDKYPFNRNFSVYEGHSWAHGSGAFGAGNNQESSSEALMSYAALIEWGEYTGNTAIRDWGIALYATHVRTIQEYWYDIDDTNFPTDWEADFAGIVWGNSVAHSTWWTADSEAVYGINMLPLSGFSMHLGRDTDLASRTFQQISALKNDEFTYWPDILWMYRAFSDPQDAIDRFEARFDSYSAEAAQPKGHTLYWLYNLQSLGSPDATVTADTPLYAVFDDGSERTYVAYNASDTATTVSFSDGTTLDVPANSLASSAGSSGGTDPAPEPEQTPYLDTPQAIPGRIQAQHYDNGGQDVAYHDTSDQNQGGAFRTGELVDVETVSDSTGGTYNVGWTADGEWLEYTVNVEQAGTYDLDLRVASGAGGGTLSVSAGGSNVAGPVSLPGTGGWQTWQTVTVSDVTLDAGEQVLRLSIDAGGFNLNWIEYTLVDGPSAPAAPTNLASPAQTSTSVDLTWDHGGSPAQFNVYLDGTVAQTTTDTATTLSGLETGTTYSVYVTAENADGVESDPSGTIEVTPSEPDPQQPYPGTPHPIPGRIQAQEYDEGGEGVAYHDTTTDNQGGAFRTGESVDVETVSDSTGGTYNVGWTADGEWLAYTVDVEQAGTYDLDFRIASGASGGTLSVSAGGTNVAGPVSLPGTGGWQTWQTVTVSDVALDAGEQVLRLSVDAGGFNCNWIDCTLVDGSGSGGSGTSYSGTTGDGWSATVTQVDTDTYEWTFEPNNAAGWADVQFADPGTDAWAGYRLDDSDGDNVHVYTRDASGDGSEIDVRFVWDDGAGGQYISDRRTHTY